MNDDVRPWLKYAETDYKVDEHLCKSFYPKPLEIICFHCQQSAEKAVKALIVNQGTKGGMPRTHDISFLLNQVSKMIVIPEQYYDYADSLSKYGVVARYPSELFLEDRDAEQALHFASELLDWVKSIVSQQS